MGERLATLYELQTVYSYGDALDLAEILQVRNHNEQMAMDNARHRHSV